jgi:hypothetical protein
MSLIFHIGLPAYFILPDFSFASQRFTLPLVTIFVAEQPQRRRLFRLLDISLPDIVDRLSYVAAFAAKDTLLFQLLAIRF